MNSDFKEVKTGWTLEAQNEAGEMVKFDFYLEIHDTRDSGLFDICINDDSYSGDLEFDGMKLINFESMGLEQPPADIFLKLEELGYDCSDFLLEYVTIQCPDGEGGLTDYCEPMDVSELSNFELQSISDSKCYETRFKAYDYGHALTLINQWNEKRVLA